MLEKLPIPLHLCCGCSRLSFLCFVCVSELRRSAGGPHARTHCRAPVHMQRARPQFRPKDRTIERCTAVYISTADPRTGFRPQSRMVRALARMATTTTFGQGDGGYCLQQQVAAPYYGLGGAAVDYSGDAMMGSRDSRLRSAHAAKGTATSCQRLEDRRLRIFREDSAHAIQGLCSVQHGQNEQGACASSVFSPGRHQKKHCAVVKSL